jgi:hypothetical protein
MKNELTQLETQQQNAIITSRTKFQLQKFTIGQHDTQPMQWRQILLEAQDLLYKIKSAEIHLRKMQIEHDKLVSTGDPIDALDAEQKQLDMIMTTRALEGAKIELEWLEDIAKEVGVYTFEEIEDDQPEYWAKRLQRQVDLDILGRDQGINPGNLQSMLNAGLLSYQEDQTALNSKVVN